MGDLILFDIDKTLFDPDRFGQLIRAEFIKILKVPEEELIRANADYYAGLTTGMSFNPHDIAMFLANKFGVKTEVLDDVFWKNDDIYIKSLYPDTVEVLRKLSASHKLGIFSQGYEDLQARKLNAADLAQYFDRDHLFIYNQKLLEDAIAALPHEATVVDNNHEVVTKIAHLVDAIWLNRMSEDNDPSIKTIHSLSELV